VDQLQGSAADEAPAGRPRLGVDASLPPGQADAAGFNAGARAVQPRHAAQRRRQIAQVRKPRTEADGVDGVNRLTVQANDVFRRQTGVFHHAPQIELQLVTTGDAVQASFLGGRRIGLPGGGRCKGLEEGGDGRVMRLIEIKEDGNTSVSLDDVQQPTRILAAYRGAEAEGRLLVGEVSKDGLVAERLERSRGGGHGAALPQEGYGHGYNSKRAANVPAEGIAVTQDEAFLQSIREDPDDDGLRLIYADWLEERGDPRGEFIRVQVELARTPPSDPRVPLWKKREHQLLAANRDAWVRPLRELLQEDAASLRDWRLVGGSRHDGDGLFRRGFPEKLTLEVRTFVERGESLLRLAPLRHLCLWGAGDGGAAPALARCPHLAGIETLEFNDYFRSPLDAVGMRELATGQYLGRLKHLLLYRNHLGDAGAAAVAAAWWPAGLRSLVLSDNGLSAEGVRELVASPHLSGLTMLLLNNNELGSAGGMAFSHWSHPANLALLSLNRCGLGDEGVSTLVRCPLLATVEALRLNGNGITDQGAAALASSPLLSRLRTLDLEGNAISEAGWRIVRDSPHLRRVTAHAP
jgi:uncharacterized protein (TIGR02996 family)